MYCGFFLLLYCYNIKKECMIFILHLIFKMLEHFKETNAKNTHMLKLYIHALGKLRAQCPLEGGLKTFRSQSQGDCRVAGLFR